MSSFFLEEKQLKLLLFQKQPSIDVLIKSCSENMQQIYGIASMLKCDFNKVARCSFGNLLHIFSKHLFLAKFCNGTFLFVVSCDLELDFNMQESFCLKLSGTCFSSLFLEMGVGELKLAFMDDMTLSYRMLLNSIMLASASIKLLRCFFWSVTRGVAITDVSKTLFLSKRFWIFR